MDNKKRLFTALRFPTTTIEEIAQLQEEIRESDPTARYVKPVVNFHMTLYFLGNVEDSRVDQVEDALKLACERYKKENGSPIELTFDHIDTFKMRQGRLLYLGVEKNPNIAFLAHLIEDELEEKGFEVERKKFRAHITLARKFKGGIPSDLSLPKPLTCTEASLVWSHTVDNVLTYDNLVKFSFAE